MDVRAGTRWEAGLGRERRRGAGVFHTPPGLIDQVLDDVLPRALSRAAWRSDGSPVLRLLDPAAGDGRFLAACAERLADAAAARGHDRARARAAIVSRCLTAVEREVEAAALCRDALPGADVRTGCALTGDLLGDGPWDVVVGNPPYVRSVTLKTADPPLWQALRGRLAATSYGEWDLYGAFLERALDWGGEVGFVVPSRWLTGAFAGPLRARLAGRVRRIVHLGASQLFAGATTYVALVFLGDGNDDVVVERDGARSVWPAAGLGAEPWRFVAAAGTPLGSLARIAKGAGSNADPVFLLERRPGGHHSRALGEAVALEPELLVPCLRGRDVGRGVVCDALLPYQHDTPLPLAVLAERFPRAHAYLERCRGLLEARERGRFRGDRFHHWGRPQNLAWLRQRTPKVVVPDAGLGGRAVVDDEGLLVIDTAYAIRPHDPAALPPARLAELLAAPETTAWLRATGLELRGGYVRMKTRYLEALPVELPGR